MKLKQQLLCAVALALVSSQSLSAQTVNWKGHIWNVNNGSLIGDGSAGGQISGSSGNVTIDSSGYLHLKISGSGSTAKGAEIYTSDRLGFGSIYYVLNGSITSMQKSVVLSGFTYGAAANVGVDGENELDVEFSQWNGTAGNINSDFTFYPNTGQGALGASYEENFLLNLGGSTVNTVRIDWSSTKVTASIWAGLVPPTASTGTAVKSHTYNGNTNTIPQSACPMMFNLWTFGAYPTQALDITVQDFQFIPQGSSPTTYNIAASAGAGGTINPPGTIAVNSGATQAFTITPSAGYSIASVVVDGTNRGAIGSYTFSNVTAPHAISASFSPSGVDSNIAPIGTGYLWSKNTTAASNANRAVSAVVNDNNLTSFVVVNPAGEGGTAKWEGAGVVWSTAKTISSAKVVNGGDDGYGNGYFQANCKLQFSTDGSTWTDSGWTISPSYPNSSVAFGKTYTFSGTAKTGVIGARIVGQTGASSWSWSVSETQFIGH
ncbi:MAG: hypothetical protein ABIY70_01395 [Capsulimonas sp.]|uniref:hypothetical protein n=1 Tax=Capsulimonas sp. TaxID=2494211 RepID=UPI003262EFA6